MRKALTYGFSLYLLMLANLALSLSGLVSPVQALNTQINYDACRQINSQSYQYDANGQTINRFFAQGEVQNGQAYLYAQDQVGSVYALIDSQGAVAGRTAYDPYGNITYQTGTQPIMAYAGLYQHKESNLYLATYRAYDPATSRWLNRDPVKEAGGLNIYAYVNGDPVNQTDTSGLIIDTAADVGFIGYDIYRLITDNVLNDCDNLGENLTALGADALGAVIPGVTGLGAASRAGAKVVKRSSRSVDELSQAASASDRGGLTAAGRAMQKHGGRKGSAFPPAKGNPTSVNQQGQDIVDDILTSPGAVTTTRNHARYGNVIEVRAPDGRGIRYDSDGKFIGLLEP